MFVRQCDQLYVQCSTLFVHACVFKQYVPRWVWIKTSLSSVRLVSASTSPAFSLPTLCSLLFSSHCNTQLLCNGGKRKSNACPSVTANNKWQIIAKEVLQMNTCTCDNCGKQCVSQCYLLKLYTVKENKYIWQATSQEPPNKTHWCSIWQGSRNNSFPRGNNLWLLWTQVTSHLSRQIRGR